MSLSGILLVTVLLTNCADVASCVFARRAGDAFELSGQVLVNDNRGDPILCLTDATGAVRIMGVRHVTNSLPFASGDIIRTSGVVAVPSDTLFGTPVAICRSVRKIADGMLPPPATATAADIQSGRYDCRHVRVRGRIRRVFRDEIDPRWIFTTLNAEDGLLYLTTRGDAALETQLRKLTDAEVTVTGICSASGSMLRRLLGQMVGFSGTNDITVLRAPVRPLFRSAS